jgi:hypothetical protein
VTPLDAARAARPDVALDVLDDDGDELVLTAGDEVLRLPHGPTRWPGRQVLVVAMPALRVRLPVAVPVPRYVGVLGDGATPFTAERRLPGTALAGTALCGIAVGQLAGTVAALRDVSEREAHAWGVEGSGSLLHGALTPASVLLGDAGLVSGVVGWRLRLGDPGRRPRRAARCRAGGAGLLTGGAPCVAATVRRCAWRPSTCSTAPRCPTGRWSCPGCTTPSAARRRRRRPAGGRPGQGRSHGLDLTAEVARAAGVLEGGREHWRFVPALVGTPGGDWRAADDGDDDTAGAHYGIGLVSRWPVSAWHVVRLPASPVGRRCCCPGRGRSSGCRTSRGSG